MPGFSRVALLGVLVVAACGKRTVAPPEPAATEAVAVLGDASAPPADEPEDPPEPAPPGPLAKTCDGVSLVLVSVNRQADVVAAVLELQSRATAHVSLMAPGDGSSSGIRNPTLQFALTPNHVAPALRCGNTNALSPQNFLMLAPGARKRLGVELAPTPSAPGRYTLQVTYRNDPNSTALGDQEPGARAARLRERVRTTVPCTLKSNAVSFVW